jgi:hypothetical protein
MSRVTLTDTGGQLVDVRRHAQLQADVLSVMDLVNHYRTPKLWAIAHENNPEMQK